MKFYILLPIILLFVGCSSKRVVYVDTQNPDMTSSQTIQKPYKVFGKWYYPHNTYIGYTQKGVSSWYGPKFHGKLTSNGEIYDMHKYTAAHKTLPINTVIKVTNLNNNKSVKVRINDRGPFVKNRILDLSYVAGKKIGIDKTGTSKVKIEVIAVNKKETKKENIIAKKSHNLEYNIQVGAFKNRSGAEIFKSEYQTLNNPIKIIKKDGVFKVFFTGFKDYQSANEFKIENNVNGFIVKFD
jgi:rare lipoprotein A